MSLHSRTLPYLNLAKLQCWLKRSILLFLASLAIMVLCIRPAVAVPIFAREYGFNCQVCHTVVPHLNAFGHSFYHHGYRIQGVKPKRILPIAVRANLAYSSEPDPAGLPKATVDELEAFVGGAAGPHMSYFAEQYLIDGGAPGATRDAWVAYRAKPFADKQLVVTGGQFTLPSPVDPETFRESSAHYAVFDQTIGASQFSFFEPKIGSSVTYGNPDFGLTGTVALLAGHDKQSGLATHGIDRMAMIQNVRGPATLSVYRYAGSRQIDSLLNSFSRQGYALTFVHGSTTLDLLLQHGHDSNPLSNGVPVESSGGFAQLRQEFNSKEYAILRLDGTADSLSGAQRTLVILYGRRFAENTRFTIEDDFTHAPQTNSVPLGNALQTHHGLRTQFTFAY